MSEQREGQGSTKLSEGLKQTPAGEVQPKPDERGVAPATQGVSRESVIDGIKSILESGGNENRLTLEGASGYFHLVSACGGETIRVQAAGRRALKDLGVPIDEARLLPLSEQAGMRRPNLGANFKKTVTDEGSESRASLADELISLAAAAYGLPLSALTLHLRLGNRERHESPEIEAAMRHLSKEKTIAARRGLYMLLAKGSLLLATETQDNSSLIKLIVDDRERSSALIFTSWASLLRFEPRGLPYCRLAGTELFPLLQELGADTLAINPRGEVGGELYRHEIESICEGLERIRGRRER
ncbi:MAG: SseB family protein [Myxococcota bacterium]|nr:SseB family protein [Myxococcota bacterium]